MENANKLEPIISVSKTYEHLYNNKGYLSTFVRINRETQEVIEISYYYHPSFNCPENQVMRFESYQTLKQYLESLY